MDVLLSSRRRPPACPSPPLRTTPTRSDTLAPRYSASPAVGRTSRPRPTRRPARRATPPASPPAVAERIQVPSPAASAKATVDPASVTGGADPAPPALPGSPPPDGEASAAPTRP